MMIVASVLLSRLAMLHIFDLIAGLPCIDNYHAVTVGPVPPLVVLIHARGQQD